MNADDITRMMDELATRLEGPARYAFELVVRQVVVEGVIAWLAVAAIAAALLIAVRLTTPHWHEESCRHDSGGLGVLACLGLSIALALVGSYAVLHLADVLNPEYAAITRLLDMVR